MSNFYELRVTPRQRYRRDQSEPVLFTSIPRHSADPSKGFPYRQAAFVSL